MLDKSHFLWYNIGADEDKYINCKRGMILLLFKIHQAN